MPHMPDRQGQVRAACVPSPWEASGASEEDGITRYVIVGQREVCEEQHRPVDPIAACGGLPIIRQR